MPPTVAESQTTASRQSDLECLSGMPVLSALCTADAPRRCHPPATAPPPESVAKVRWSWNHWWRKRMPRATGRLIHGTSDRRKQMAICNLQRSVHACLAATANYGWPHEITPGWPHSITESRRPTGDCTQAGCPWHPAGGAAGMTNQSVFVTILKSYPSPAPPGNRVRVAVLISFPVRPPEIRHAAGRYDLACCWCS